MTAEVVELRKLGEPDSTIWVRVSGTAHHNGWFSVEEAREIASALHRYDLAQAHEERS